MLKKSSKQFKYKPLGLRTKSISKRQGIRRLKDSKSNPFIQLLNNEVQRT